MPTIKQIPCLILLLLFVMACNSYYQVSEKEKTFRYENKRIQYLPASIYSDTSLEVISLFGNKLSDLPDSFACFQQLRVLYLGKNDFKTFPKVILKLKNLEVLSLINNSLDSIPEEIFQLKKLRILLLQNNRMVEVSKGISQLSDLEQLNISYNFLTQLPDSLFQLKKMWSLNVSNNQIGFISDSIGNATELRELFCSQRGLLLKPIQGLCNLKKLDLLSIDNSFTVPNCLLLRKTDRLQIRYDQ